jgi:GDPmannose 4,6-dehydratase
MTALIFGANGQDGHYLTKLCATRGIKPIGISRSAGDHRGDVSDYAFVSALVRQYIPSYIFHLAAHSTTSHDVLFENHAAIAGGTLNILEAARQHSPEARVFITGSGLQFMNTGAPISADAPFEARSAYAAARIAATFTARYYRTIGVRAYVGYLFHHESPLRKPGHVSKQVALAVRRIRHGEEEELTIGNLDVAKEWTFAGDVAEAMLTLIDQDAVYEAVIGSGTTYSIRDWVIACFTHAHLDWRRYVRTREGFAPEYPVLVSDPKVIHGLGWSPRVSFEALAEMMIQES